MKKLGSSLFTVILAGSLIVTPVFAEPSVDELEADKAVAQEQVNSLQDQLADLMSKVGDLEEKLIAKGEEIMKAEGDLQEAEEKQQEQYEAMKLRIKYMYEQGETSFMESLVTAENFSDLVNKAEYVQNVHTYDRDRLQEYVDTKNRIDNLKKTLVEEQTRIESMQAEYEVKESELSATIETKRAEVAGFDEQIQAAAEAAAAQAAQQDSVGQERQNNNGSGNTGGQNAAPPTGSGGSSGGAVSGGTGSTSAAQAIVNAAYTQLGVPYKWGGSSPGAGLDCSGLTQFAHRAAGISIGRTSEVQGGGGRAVSSPQPGDIVCYGSHVGIYIGGGQMIHAPRAGEVVKVAAVYGSPWYRRYW